MLNNFHSIFPGGLKEVADAASEYWKNLSDKEKEPYVLKAKQAKTAPADPRCDDTRERYTSLGIPLSQVIREKEEREEKVRQAKFAVDKMLETCFVDARLDCTPFFILTFNYFTKDIKGKYYPCEMGLVKFTIAKGVTTKCHSLINPLKLPLGHAFAAKDHSERTHKLTPPPNALGDTDYSEILTTMVEFLKVNDDFGNGKKFKLLVMEDEKEMVENILTQFCEVGEVDIKQFELLPLTYFFEKLRLQCEIYYLLETDIPFSYAVACSHLERDIYQYYRGNGCPIHEEDEVNNHCALSKATRWAYTILDQTMDVCEVTKKCAGLHYPIDCLIEPAAETKDEKKEREKQDNDSSDQSDDESKISILTSGQTSVRTIPRGRVKDEFDDAESLVSDFADRLSLFGPSGRGRGGYNNYSNRKETGTIPKEPKARQYDDYKFF